MLFMAVLIALIEKLIYNDLALCKKTQQTKILVKGQRFGDLFFFWLGW
jgi:hypothetical protein